LFFVNNAHLDKRKPQQINPV